MILTILTLVFVKPVPRETHPPIIYLLLLIFTRFVSIRESS